MVFLQNRNMSTLCFRHQVLILGSAGRCGAGHVLFHVAHDPLHMVVLLVLVVNHYTGLVQKRPWEGWERPWEALCGLQGSNASIGNR